MLTIYSFFLSVGFILLIPVFIIRRSKYAAGFRQRLGRYEPIDTGGRPVIWLHCVSVGEVNAARPLVDLITARVPEMALVVSATTKTGHRHASNIFSPAASAIVYFPFDFKFSVDRALDAIRPRTLILMETELWPRLISEAARRGCQVAIANGRLSERSARRYSWLRPFIRRILSHLDLAAMQNTQDADRVKSLGVAAEKIAVTGNIKYDHSPSDSDSRIADEIKEQFGLGDGRKVLIAASTHDPEEKWVLDAYAKLDDRPRLVIAPRHPEKFDGVAQLVRERGFSLARRSEQGIIDREADVILLDTIGELRGAFHLADAVFMGGSLIPHGGQSMIEPAAAGKAMIVGPFTHNFANVVREMLSADAIMQISGAEKLYEAIESILRDNLLRERLGENALQVIRKNTGAAERTFAALRPLLTERRSS